MYTLRYVCVGLGRSAEAMLIMKGTPDAPRCGFSRSIMALLREEGIDFESFDILEDQDVRQCLKDLFDWPTFPQVINHRCIIIVSDDCLFKAVCID